ncbi:P-loop containing nucleoside triphosphate hydrolase protein [Roridomyces roridus]|uniref:DNA 3'-5' helicase n=1 Tax=Roridomyces roridus TaxID=1738132 RepID=A0AAD7CAJ0_9AGAR|nr:P-loop containing nucleoside triphosphate hydrolase protein [Roridomyces roridus]KAJ7643855.1 P-loop containing nucleoside triphosphate hydrolase protein [Roridomyces roridus]
MSGIGIPRHHGKTPKGHPAPRVSAKITEEQLKAIDEELKLLPELIRTHFTKWTNGAKPFQIQCMNAQVLGQDTLLHAATGAGKTGIAAGPHLLPSSKGKVTLMVSPLLSLHDEQVSTFRNEFGLKATAINSANGGCTNEIMAKVVEGEWQIVMLSPEMLLSRRFVEGVLRKPAFGARCLSVFIDEAHCVSHWGASFRKKYASIGIIRAFLPRTTPIIAVTATLTPRVRQDLVVKLQFNPNDYHFCTIGNDRPNVSQIIRSMEHPANSYADLDFLVSDAMTVPEDIKKTFLYTDDIKDGGKVIDYLNARVKASYQSRGLVRPYNAGMSREYRAQVMELFKSGVIRILVCTDAAGMGCDIPDIALVVQWKLPQNLSSWVQRAGRAARGPRKEGLAVMIVEKSAFETGALTAGATDVVTAAAPTEGRGGGGRARGRGRGGRGGTGRRGRGKGKGKDYAESHGLKRGWSRGADDFGLSPLADSEAEIPVDAPAEGLYALVQATTCRRRILARVFRNAEPTVPKESCCDVCNPKLFDHTRPSKPCRVARQKGIRKGPAVDSVREALFNWRREIKKKHFSHALFAPHAILDDATCELLASIGPIDTIAPLQQLLQSSWSRWNEFGQQLFEYMHKLPIPPLPAPAPRKKATAPQPPPPTSTPSTPGPSSTASLPAKRTHPTHGTAHDTDAPLRTRPRPGASTYTSQPTTPQRLSATPTPTHQYYAMPLTPSTSDGHG